jgi:hypothetical protein
VVTVKSSQNPGYAKKGMLRIQRYFPALILVTLLVSCSSQKSASSSPTATPKPVNTATVLPAKGVTATTVPEVIEISSGGFTLAIQPGLDFEAHEDSISISDRRGEFIVSLNGRPYVASSYTLQSFLGKYLAEMASRGGSFDQGEPYEIVIDDKNGLAIDFSGSFLDNPVTGKAVAVSPGEDFIVFGLGMSLLNEHENGWDESGSMIFENILDSIDFKEEVK